MPARSRKSWTEATWFSSARNLGMSGSASLRGASAAVLLPLAAERPAKRVRLGAVPVRDEPEHAPPQLGLRRERAVLEDTLREDAEPDLDLVHPGGVQRGMDEVESTPMSLVEDAPAVAVMRVEVVPHDVDLAGWVALRERLHERDQAVRGATTTLTEHLTRAGVERGNQRHGAAAAVLELLA